MLKEPLNDVLKAGGLFCGGFVRDYLIRGEQFNDLDFYFPKEIPEPYASWPFIGGAKTKFFEGTKFHCGISPYDLTCNVFSFDGEKIVARPTYMTASYAAAWRMILEKRFIFTNLADIIAREKMKRRGWIMEGIDFKRRPAPYAPTAGPWSDFTLAAERFHALTRL
jgi:hypothetical protein